MCVYRYTVCVRRNGDYFTRSKKSKKKKRSECATIGICESAMAQLPISVFTLCLGYLLNEWGGVRRCCGQPNLHAHFPTYMGPFSLPIQASDARNAANQCVNAILTTCAASRDLSRHSATIGHSVRCAASLLINKNSTGTYASAQWPLKLTLAWLGQLHPFPLL